MPGPSRLASAWIPWLYLLVFAAAATAEMVCPSLVDKCMCTFASDNQPLAIICSGLNSTRLPAFLNTVEIFPEFIIQDSYIKRLQTRAFSDLNLQRITVNGSLHGVVEYGALAGLSEHLESITFVGNNITDIPASTFTDFAHLYEIKLEHNNIKTLRDDIFVRLRNISSISLAGNQLTEIPSELFTELRKLQTIILDDNHLENIPNDAFSNLINLKKLSINNNRLSSLSSEVFGDLGKLSSLSLSWNELTDLPSNLLHSAIELKEFYVKYNKIREIPNDLLFFCREIEQLDFSHNLIHSIDTFPFQGLSNLQALPLNDNKLLRVPAHVFEDLVSITKLELQSNAIVDLEPNCLVGLYATRVLLLQQNNISNLPFGVFDPLGRARFVNLSHNSIAWIEGDPFLSNRELEVLDLSWNLLSAVNDGWVGKPESLIELHLEHNRIWVVANDSFLLLPYLKKLYLQNNRIYMPDGYMFEKCTQLEVLDLSRNPLVQLPRSMFHGPTNLKELHLDFACLEYLPAGIFNSSTGVATIEKLFMSYNFIQEIPPALLTGLSNLRVLDLSHNDLTVEPYTFQFLSKLVFLNMSHNHISSEQFTPNFYSLQELILLDLSANELTYMEDHSLDIMIQLDAVYIAGNPFICNCDSTWWRGSEVLMDWDDFRCAEPPEMTGILVTCVNESSISCPPHRFTMPWLEEFCEDISEFPYIGKPQNQSIDSYAWYDESYCTVIHTEAVTQPTTTIVIVHVDPIQILKTTADVETIQLTWVASEVPIVLGYYVIHRLFATNDSEASGMLDVNQTEHVIDRLIPNQNYVICVDLQLKNGSYLHFDDSCHEVKTLPKPAPGTPKPVAEEDEEDFTIILSITGAAAFVLIVIIVCVVCCCVHKIKKEEKLDRANNGWIKQFIYSGNMNNEQMVEQTTITCDIQSPPEESNNGSDTSTNRLNP